MVNQPVDLAVARRWVGGDRTLLLELVGIFVGEAAARIAELRSALTARDVRDLERLAHSLKSSAGILGAQDLQGLCAALEAAVREQRLEAAPELLARLDGELTRVVAFFRDPAWQDRLDGVQP
ncbi:MAG: Hpt domain-containing protein [Candidatus Rokuibacteriota bacterium]